MSDVQLDVTKLLRNTLRDPYIALPPDDNYHGVIHWIATDGFSREWKNPYLTKKINVLAIDGHYLAGHSIVSSVTENLEVVVGKPGRNCLASFPAPSNHYFTIDLGDRSVIMSHYRLFSSYGQGEFLNNFDISVSNDNTTWDLVQTHSNAKSEVPVLFECPRNTKPFRYFRLFSVETIVIGSIEIFGKLRAIKST
jgi:hypothetical protein